MKVEHQIMTVHLEAREVAMINKEYRELKDMLFNKCNVELYKRFQAIDTLIGYIGLCGNNKAHTIEEPLDRYHKQQD